MIALPARASPRTVLLRLERNLCPGLALGTDNHDVREIDRAFLLGDTALDVAGGVGLGVPLDEMKEDRPSEYARLSGDKAIDEKLVEAPPRWLVVGSRIFGLTCLCIGILVIVLIIYAMLFLYR